MRLHIRRLTAEHQRAGAGAGVPQRGHDDISLSGLTVPDRRRLAGVPQIELTNVPGRYTVRWKVLGFKNSGRTSRR